MVHEVLVDRGREVGRVTGALEGLAHPLPRAHQRLDADLLLAAREVVVHGAERGVALGDNLFDARRRIALATEQVNGRVEDPVAGVASVGRSGHGEKGSTESM